jgi:hypothetical protein
VNISPDDETEVSLEDSIREQFQAAQQAEEEPGEILAPEQQAEPEAEAAGDRDEKGRFKPKVATEEAAPSDPEPEAQEKALPDPYGLAPQYASKVVKEKWKDLPPELRQEYHDREKTFHRELTRQDEDRNFGKQIKDIVKPYEAMITSLGATPAAAVDYLIKTDYLLRTGSPEQKREAFMRAAKDYGIDLGQAQPQGEQQAATDPRVETLQQRIDRLESERNNDIASRRDEEQRTINAQIESFASRPENVYFERVKPVMATLLQSGQADSLEKAYDMAVHADPETRALHLDAARVAEDRKRTSAAVEQAAKARRASPSVTGAPANGVPASQLNGASNSVEDDVRAALASVAGRA